MQELGGLDTNGRAHMDSKDVRAGMLIGLLPSSFFKAITANITWYFFSGFLGKNLRLGSALGKVQPLWHEFLVVIRDEGTANVQLVASRVVQELGGLDTIGRAHMDSKDAHAGMLIGLLSSSFFSAISANITWYFFSGFLKKILASLERHPREVK